MGVDPLSYFESKNQTEAINTGSQLASDSADKAIKLQKEMYDTSRADQEPWRQAGANALSQLSYGTGVPGSATGTGVLGELSKPFSEVDYKEDPGYAFRLSEGIKALDRSASSRGQVLSGGALKGLTEYGQNMGSQEYQNAFNRYTTSQNQRFNQLASIAGVGQTANNALGQAGQAYATSAGNTAMSNAANQANAGLALAGVNSSMYSGFGKGASQGMNALGQWAANANWGGGGNSYSGDPSASNFVGPSQGGSGSYGSSSGVGSGGYGSSGSVDGGGYF